MTDIEIAQQHVLKPITSIAKKAGISKRDLIPYGSYKAKVSLDLLKRSNHKGKLILVTAINPTPAGEGKTTTSIGLADALTLRHKKTILALREPSIGPVFGVKGGATGGGYSQVVPMEDINLHFTGDFHAITCANNLLAAMVDNHIHQGNELQIDPEHVVWKRCLDMNDRQLRFIEDGLGGNANGTPRKDGFDITAASEIMAIFCLATSVENLKERLGNILVGYTFENKPVYARELHAEGAMTALLLDALNPNLVQTLGGTPTLIHGGPFANIAHGCNSVLATKMALALGDYVVTEAGFGADLGAEKFLDIKCRSLGLHPDVVVLVGTIRALKMHGGVDKKDLGALHMKELKAGVQNLMQHLTNIKTVYGLPCVVALNKFPQDREEEIACVKDACRELGVEVLLSEVFEKGGAGGLLLADEVLRLCNTETDFHFAYEVEQSIKEKIQAVATKIYHADGAEFSEEAEEQIRLLESLGCDKIPVCIAKTQYSFSDDPKLVGAPKHFTLHVRAIRYSAGAGFIVALTGSIMTMPGLPKVPAAEQITVDSNGTIHGLF